MSLASQAATEHAVATDPTSSPPSAVRHSSPARRDLESFSTDRDGDVIMSDGDDETHVSAEPEPREQIPSFRRNRFSRAWGGYDIRSSTERANTGTVVNSSGQPGEAQLPSSPSWDRISRAFSRRRVGTHHNDRLPGQSRSHSRQPVSRGSSVTVRPTFNQNRHSVPNFITRPLSRPLDRVRASHTRDGSQQLRPMPAYFFGRRNNRPGMPHRGVSRIFVSRSRNASQDGVNDEPTSTLPSRLARVRHSISLPLQQVLARSQSSTVSRESVNTGTRSPELPILPPLPSSGLDLNVDVAPTSAAAAAAFSMNRSRSTGGSSEQSSRPARGSGTIPGLESVNRPRNGEGQAQMLSRLLSVAAAATAASLVGNTERAFSQARDVGGDHMDGSFENFLSALRTGRLAAALRNGGNEPPGSQPSPGEDDSDLSLGPMNFFRMFRFGSSEGDGPDSAQPARASNRANSSTQQNAGSSDRSEEEEGPSNGGRMIPVIIVGIRSLPRDDINREETTTQNFFDALSNLALHPSQGVNRTSPGNFIRRTESRSRFRARRASMVGMGGSSLPYDNQRHHGRSTPSSRPTSEYAANSSHTADISESPPGPHPPPSTPADPGLSTFPTSSFMPSRRLSVTNPSDPSPRRVPLTPMRQQTSTGRLPISSELETPAPSHARTRSESDILRRHTFGHGSSRRNGMIGLDSAPEATGSSNSSPPNNTAAPAEEGTRSWIIYVLGGSYPENHPILTTPSLFTDTPSYEDMMMLASLIGPAKPPTATQDDVNAAGGVYIVGGLHDPLVTRANPGDHVQMIAGDRCTVCLSDYEIHEEIRILNGCAHLFHRECIDQV
jgi:hypothetical protein